MISAEHWSNWANNQTCKVNIFYPKTIEELQKTVACAKKNHKKIRAYGTGHSWSDIVCTNDYLINTDGLNKIIDIDTSKNQVTVQAGIKLEDLNAELDKVGLALPNQGAITKQSLGGVVSTGTHGSGKTGTYADFITEVKLLGADGVIRTISPTQNSELWPAARTNIGCLGIVVEYTVQCVPQFFLERKTIDTTWNKIIKDYKKLLDENDYMEFTMSASDDAAQVTVSNRIENGKNSQKSYKVLSGVLIKKYVEIEVAVPMNQFIPAAQAARDFIKAAYKRNPEFDGLLFRFVRGEKQNILSPAGDRDVCYFSLTVSPQTEYESFFREYYKRLIQFGARPHWGKINYLTQSDAQKLYGNNYNQFVQIRKKLDPQGLFSNNFTKRIFGW